MSFDPIVSGSLSFLVVLILMALNVPIGISMLVVGFTGFALITGFEQALFVLGTAPFEAVSKYTLSVLPLFVLMGNLANRANLSRNLYDAAASYKFRDKFALFARFPIKTKRGNTDKVYLETASNGAVPKTKRACSKPVIKAKPVKPTTNIEIPIGTFNAIRISTTKKDNEPLTIGSKLMSFHSLKH